ncbi:MAG: hypothetical protein ABI536_06470 [Gallionella sp.]
MDEHAHPPCSSDCALDELVGLQINSIEDVSNLNVKNIIDWPKSELAAYIFGGNEPPGKLFTASHEFVIIDSEQMFSTGPSPFGNSAPWMWRANRSFSESGHALAVTVCKEISSLPASFVEEVLAIPNGILIDLRWPIMPKLKASIEFARNYAR